MRQVAIAITLAAVQACTWVELSEGGQAVTVVSSVPESCKRLGLDRVHLL